MQQRPTAFAIDAPTLEQLTNAVAIRAMAADIAPSLTEPAAPLRDLAIRESAFEWRFALSRLTGVSSPDEHAREEAKSLARDYRAFVGGMKSVRDALQQISWLGVEVVGPVNGEMSSFNTLRRLGNSVGAHGRVAEIAGQAVDAIENRPGRQKSQQAAKIFLRNTPELSAQSVVNMRKQWAVAHVRHWGVTLLAAADVMRQYPASAEAMSDAQESLLWLLGPEAFNQWERDGRYLDESIAGLSHQWQGNGFEPWVGEVTAALGSTGRELGL